MISILAKSLYIDSFRFIQLVNYHLL